MASKTNLILGSTELGLNEDIIMVDNLRYQFVNYFIF